MVDEGSEWGTGEWPVILHCDGNPIATVKIGEPASSDSGNPYPAAPQKEECRLCREREGKLCGIIKQMGDLIGEREGEDGGKGNELQGHGSGYLNTQLELGCKQ